tara:strand:- start:2388 stop:2930 length:543 start_codon:yes stop_codon:yes gene_type:complete
MFRDMNESNKKKTVSNSKEEILKIADEINEIANDDTGISNLTIIADKKTAFCNVTGNFGVLHKALLENCLNDDDFSKLIKSVAAEAIQEEMGPEEIQSLGKFLKKHIEEEGGDDTSQKEIEDNVKRDGISKFKTKDGEEGFAIDADSIDDMTDEQIDDIVANMLKSKNIGYNPGKDGESK